MKIGLGHVAVLLSLLFVLLAGSAHAQTPTFPGSLLPGSNIGAQGSNSAMADTAQGRPVGKRKKHNTAADSLRRTERLFGRRLTRPAKAGFLALLPGGGQIYNHKYWKLPLVYGAVGGMVYGEITFWKGYKEFARDYTERTDNKSDTNYHSELTRQYTTDDQVYRALQVYRSNRDRFLAYTAFAYALTIVDAIVDAHLHDFDVSDDLALHWEPTMLRVPGTAATATGVALTFNLKSHPTK